MKKSILIFAMLFAFTSQAQALFEIRAGYGVNTPADSRADIAGGLASVGLTNMSGFNLDAIVEPPMIPFGFGLRYESMGFDIEDTGVGNFESDLERISLLVNYRIIDLFFYFGAIATIGFSNDVTVNVPGAADATYDADLTYSIGAEAGVSLGLIQLGAELGYNIATYENSSNSPSELNFDGVYMKALVGVGF